MLSAVARETGLGKGTVHRLLNALIDAGLVFQDHETKRYRLGVGLARLGHAAHRQDFAALAKPFLLRLAERNPGHRSTLRCARVQQPSASPARSARFRSARLSLDAGHLRPLGVGSGSLALLAFLPDEEIASIIDKNAVWLARYRGHARKELLAKVADTRQRGFSFVEGKIVPGMNAMGVPILGADGRPVAALSLAAITDRVSGARVTQLARLLTHEAAELGKAMGLPGAIRCQAAPSGASDRGPAEQQGGSRGRRRRLGSRLGQRQGCGRTVRAGRRTRRRSRRRWRALDETRPSSSAKAVAARPSLQTRPRPPTSPTPSARPSSACGRIDILHNKSVAPSWAIPSPSAKRIGSGPSTST